MCIQVNSILQIAVAAARTRLQGTLPRLVMQRSVAMRNTPGMTIIHHAFVSRAFLPTETRYASYSPRMSSSGAGMG